MTSFSRVLIALALSGVGLCTYAETLPADTACDAPAQNPKSFLEAVRSGDTAAMETAAAQPDFAKEAAENPDLLLQVLRAGGNPRALALLLPHVTDVNRRYPELRNRTALHYAVQTKQAAAVALLRQYGADTGVKDDDGKLPHEGAVDDPAMQQLLLRDDTHTALRLDTALHLAVRAGHEDAVRDLINGGADATAKNPAGRTPLMYAVEQLNVPMLRQLLRAEPNGINTETPHGYTALLLLAATVEHQAPNRQVSHVDRAKYWDVMKLLLDSGADVNHRAKDGVMPLSYSLPQEFTRLLREAGAKFPQETEPYQAALQRYLAAAAENRTDDAWQLVCKEHLLLNAPLDKTGLTLLMKAVREHNTPLAETLLFTGAKADVQDAEGFTALNYARQAGDKRMLWLLQQQVCSDLHPGLHEAVLHGNTEKVRSLLQKGADPNAVHFGSSRPTPLQCVSSGPMKEMAALLLEAGADPNMVLANTTPAFFNAFFSYEPCTELAELFAAHGVDVNLRDARGNTALFAVVSFGFPHVAADVRWLLQHGAAADAVNKRGETPHMLCRRAEALELLLQEAPQHADRADAAGNTPLLHIVRRMQLPQYNAKGEDTGWEAAELLQQIRLLTARGVNVNAADAQGQTALMLAAERRQGAAVELLLAAGANPALKDAAGLSALSYAHASGDEAIISLLQEHGAPAGLPEELADALAAGDEARTRELLAKGVDMARFGTMEIEAALSTRHGELIPLLCEAGADLNAQDARCHTLLQRAVLWQDAAGLQALLQAGADVNAQGNLSNGRTGTALTEALLQGQPELARLLLEAGAVLQPPTRYLHRQPQDCGDGKPVPVAAQDLHNAVRGNSIDCVKLLAAHGMLPPAGFPLAHFDFTKENLNNTELIALLLEEGCSVEDPYRTLLHKLLHAKAHDTLRLLLNAGYDTSGTDRYGRNMLYHCSMVVPRDILERLLADKPDINAAATAEAGGDTPLIVMVAHRHYQWPEPKLTAEEIAAQDAETAELVQLFLQAGADPAKKGGKGKTALDYARERGYTRCAELLQQAMEKP